MSIEATVSQHYTKGGLLERIKAGLAAAGADPEAPTPEDLKPVDEFHIGGLEATQALVDQMAVAAGMEVLDIGSGIGGTARHIARACAARVTGIDLTEEFVATATALSSLSGMADATRFRQASALDLPFGEGAFDRALLAHVGMNIPDKTRLIAEAARVLRPGGIFGIYDVMAENEEGLVFPVPWASTADGSALATLDVYADAGRAAGFEVAATRSRRDFALDFFTRMQAGMAGADGPPPLGLHLLMGADAGVKISNMVTNLKAGRYAPTELILQKPA